MNVVRISDSCTTGWLNWGHGELWLSADHLIRVPRTSLTVKSAVRGASFGIAGEVIRGRLQQVPIYAVDDQSWSAGVTASTNVLKVNLTMIYSASFEPGKMTSRLRLNLRGGQRHKLLWMRNDKVNDIVQQAVYNTTAHHRAFTAAIFTS